MSAMQCMHVFGSSHAFQHTMLASSDNAKTLQIMKELQEVRDMALAHNMQEEITALKHQLSIIEVRILQSSK